MERLDVRLDVAQLDGVMLVGLAKADSVDADLAGGAAAALRVVREAGLVLS